MQDLKIRDRASSVEQGFTGNAAVYSKSYGDLFFMTTMERTIDSLTAEFVGDLHYGEAERFILDPLYDVSKKYLDDKTEDNAKLIQTFFLQASMSYSVIQEVFTLGGNKEVSKDLSGEMIKASPIFQAVQQWAAETGVVEKEDKKSPAKPFTLMSMYLRGHQTDKQGTAPSAEDVLSSLMSAPSMPAELLSWADSPSGIMPFYDALLSYTKKGKGLPLERTGRSELLDKISTIRSAVSALAAEYAKQAGGGKSSDTVTSMYMSAFSSLSIALIKYLHIAQEPDNHFPYGAPPSQIASWMLLLKTQARKMAHFWADLATVALDYYIRVSHELWNEELKWMTSWNLEFTTLSEARTLLAESFTEFEPVSSSMIKDIVKEMLTSFKTYLAVDTILPPDKHDTIKKLIETVKVPTDYKVSVATLKAGWVPNSVREFPRDRVSILQSKFALSAQVITEAIYAFQRTRSVALMAWEDALDLQPFVTIDTASLIRMATSTSIREVSHLSFQTPHPMERKMAKYRYSETGALSAAMEDVLFQPIWKELWMQSLALEEPQMMWDRTKLTTSTDVISAPLTTSPVPAVYTRSRNRLKKSLTIREWVSLMRDSMQGVPEHLLLREIAIYIHTMGDQIKHRIVDALSASMFVYKGDKLDFIEPQLPTIYGAPLSAIAKKNKELLDKRDSSQYGEDTPVVKITLTEQDAPEIVEDVSYIFHLHELVPKPAKLAYVTFNPTRGVSWSMPVLKDAYDPLVTKGKSTKSGFAPSDPVKADSVKSADTVDNIAWLESEGLAGFRLLMPHITFTVWDPQPDFFDDTWVATAHVDIAKRINPHTSALEMRAKYYNSPVILDDSDLRACYESEDPTPSDLAYIEKPAVAAPVHSEKPGSPTAPIAKPSQIAPEGAEAAQDVADASGSHILQTTAKVGEALSSQVSKVSPNLAAAKEAPVDQSQPQSGDPAQGADKNPIQAPSAQMKYYKKLKSDGSLDEVVALPSSEQPPSGFVPATEAEYKLFKSQSQAQTGDASSDSVNESE